MKTISEQIEGAVGGVYQMADGREFWMDKPVAEEITRRVLSEVLLPKNELREASIDALNAMKHAETFVNSKQFIKQPEGATLYSNSMDRLRQALDA